MCLLFYRRIKITSSTTIIHYQPLINKGVLQGINSSNCMVIKSKQFSIAAFCHYKNVKWNDGSGSQPRLQFHCLKEKWMKMEKTEREVDEWKWRMKWWRDVKKEKWNRDHQDETNKIGQELSKCSRQGDQSKLQSDKSSMIFKLF